MHGYLVNLVPPVGRGTKVLTVNTGSEKPFNRRVPAFSGFLNLRTFFNPSWGELWDLDEQTQGFFSLLKGGGAKKPTYVAEKQKKKPKKTKPDLVSRFLNTHALVCLLQLI